MCHTIMRHACQKFGNLPWPLGKIKGLRASACHMQRGRWHPTLYIYIYIYRVGFIPCPHFQTFPGEFPVHFQSSLHCWCTSFWHYKNMGFGERCVQAENGNFMCSCDLCLFERVCVFVCVCLSAVFLFFFRVLFPLFIRCLLFASLSLSGFCLALLFVAFWWSVFLCLSVLLTLHWLFVSVYCFVSLSLYCVFVSFRLLRIFFWGGGGRVHLSCEGCIWTTCLGLIIRKLRKRSSEWPDWSKLLK